MADSTTNPSDKAKMVKKKGPIRTGAVVPSLLIILLTYLYFAFFFDGHLRRAIEWTATRIHGAEVNVNSVSTSFLNGSFQLNGLKITDKNQPARNLFEVGKIRFQFMWDALLRMKFVVQESSIENVQALVPRPKPGYVIPPEAKNPDKPGTLDEVEAQVLDQAQSKFSDNVLGDVASVLDGTDPSAQLKNLQAQLKSDAKIKELEAALKEKEKLWKERLDKLPKTKQMDDLVARAKNIKIDTSNPLKAAEDIKQIESLIREGDKIIKDFKAASDDITSDVGQFNASIKGLEELAKNDIKDLQKRLKIPDINTKDISKDIFGKMLSKKLGSYAKYLAVAKEYMPPKKSKEEKKPDLIPRPRGQGRNFLFPVTTGYPLFWLKKASISSEVSQSEYSGNISGQLLDLTSDPSLINKPAQINIAGDFPQHQIAGLTLNIVLDYRGESGKENIDFKIQSYPVGEQVISNSSDVKFIMAKANGGLSVRGQAQEGQVQFVLANAFSNIHYDIDAKSSLVKDILQGVAKDIPVVDVKAEAMGSWSDLQWRINSNLGQALADGFRKQIQAKIDAAKAQLNEFVNNRISSEKQKLMGEYNKVKGQVDGVLDKTKNDLEKAKGSVQAQVDSEKKKGQGKVEDAAKKLLKGLGL